MKTLYGIQYLRAFAALAVVVFHAAERTNLHFAIGAAGVDVFFVVSGFIMMAISDRRPMQPVAFLRDRLLRIAPSYWIVTGIMIAGAAAGLFPNLELDIAHVLGSFLFIPVPSPNTGHLWPVLVQGWTLNYEIFFYAVFALALLVRPSFRLTALATALALLVLAGISMQPQTILAAFYTQPLLLEFAAGAFLAKLWKNGALPSPLIGVLLVVLSIGGFAMIHLLKLEFGAFNCGPLAVLLVLGMLAIENAGKLPSIPFATYIGNASYSIYLWHTLALSVVVKAGMALGLPSLLIAAAGIAAGTIAGVIAYECVEKPIQGIVKGRRLAGGRRPVHGSPP